jgi:hypothetical protein
MSVNQSFATTPDEWRAENHDHPETRGYALLSMVAVLSVLVVTTLSLRVYSRVFFRRPFSSDDWFIFSSTVCSYFHVPESKQKTMKNKQLTLRCTVLLHSHYSHSIRRFPSTLLGPSHLGYPRHSTQQCLIPHLDHRDAYDMVFNPCQTEHLYLLPPFPIRHPTKPHLPLPLHDDHPSLGSRVHRDDSYAVHTHQSRLDTKNPRSIMFLRSLWSHRPRRRRHCIRSSLIPTSLTKNL